MRSMSMAAPVTCGDSGCNRGPARGIALAVAFADLRLPSSSARHRAAIDLAAMAAQAWISGQRRGRPMIASCDSAEVHDGSATPPACEQPDQRAGGGKLRAVDQRQPLFRAKHDRLSPALAVPRAPPSVCRQKRLARADHTRPYAPAGPDRPMPRPSPCPGPPASRRRQHRFELRATTGRTPDAPRPSDKQLERHHQAHRRGSAAARRRSSGQDQVALQRAVIFRRDADAGELAEPGVDAIDRIFALRRLRNQRGRGINRPIA